MVRLNKKYAGLRHETKENGHVLRGKAFLILKIE